MISHGAKAGGLLDFATNNSHFFSTTGDPITKLHSSLSFLTDSHDSTKKECC